MLIWNVLQVANLSLYAVALIVFNISEAKTHADIENQVWVYFGSDFRLLIHNFGSEFHQLVHNFGPLLHCSQMNSTDGLHTCPFLLVAALWDYFILEPRSQGIARYLTSNPVLLGWFFICPYETTCNFFYLVSVRYFPF